MLFSAVSLGSIKKLIKAIILLFLPITLSGAGSCLTFFYIFMIHFYVVIELNNCICLLANHWVSSGSTQSFTLPSLIKWVPGTPGNWIVRNSWTPSIKRRHKVFVFLTYCIIDFWREKKYISDGNHPFSNYSKNKEWNISSLEDYAHELIKWFNAMFQWWVSSIVLF